MNCHGMFLVGGDLTILKNDGVRQWGWDYPIYEMENTMFETTNQIHPSLSKLVTNKSHVPNHRSQYQY